MKKTGTSACADVPVSNKGLNKFAVNPTARIVYDLFKLKVILFHIM